MREQQPERGRRAGRRAAEGNAARAPRHEAVGHYRPATAGAGTPGAGATGVGTTAQLPAQAATAALTATRPAAPARRRGGILNAIIGVIGELLITAGIVVGLFIVWQVYWTDLGANRDQAQQIENVNKQWGDPRGASKVGTPRTDAPPAADHVNRTGDLEGIIYIPRFGADWRYTVKYGVDLEAVVDTGSFGHYPDTQYVGEVGNYAITAHRQTYGAAMRDVPELQPGDPIIVQTKNAYYVYKVSEHEVVPPTQVGVLAPVPNHPEEAPTQRILTITTCHPPFVSSDRWITYATLDHWVDAAEGAPAELVK
ncbi:class E sortase [Actinotignum schaalii]|uniref:class E sortase n=1 Tax=Actinotignum TaxID=1653174 RepID=UPI00040E06E5|nr:class E sortase [Actinotignum schaalii]AIE83002.1 sortase [Actinotignum schaalii]WQN45149.1 class E sortase [Actinotignum schaalii]